MKYNLEKTTQVINDLIIFCHELGASHFESEIVQKTEHTYFCLKSHVPELDPKILKHLKHDLMQDRQHEVEEMYWSIIYDSANPIELTTIGMMLDDVTVDYIDGVLIINGHRKND
ncbi:MAG: hypothetical protein ACK5LL_02050 [Suipraeoptans sp.]